MGGAIGAATGAIGGELGCAGGGGVQPALLLSADAKRLPVGGVAGAGGVMLPPKDGDAAKPDVTAVAGSFGGADDPACWMDA